MSKYRKNKEFKPDVNGSKVAFIPRKVRRTLGRNIVVKINKNYIPEGVKKEEIVAGYLIKNNEEKEEDLNKEHSKNKRRLIALGVLPIAIFGLRGCVSEAAPDKTVQETEVVTQQIEGNFYETKDPSEIAWLLTGAVGQEEMTNGNALYENPFYNEEYNAYEHSLKENESLSSQNLFSENKKIIDENLEKLQSRTLSQEDISNAVDSILEASSNIQNIYEDKLDFVNDRVDEFVDATAKNPDDITRSETNMAYNVRDSYSEEIGLSQANLDFINSIRERLDNGEQISIIDINKSLDGDKAIKLESCKEVVVEREERGIKAAMSKLKNFFSRDRENNIEEYDDVR